MSATIDIAVVGATGLVGEALVELLDEQDFPVGDLHLLASDDSAGKSLPFRGRNLRVRDVTGFDFQAVGLTFLCAGSVVAHKLAPQALAAGSHVIDLTGGAEGGRLALAALPAQIEEGGPVLLRAPVAAAAEVGEVLAAIASVASVQGVVLMACLSASQLGREGVQELARQTAELLNARPLEPRLIDRQYAFNMLGQVGSVDEQGHSALEKRLHAELIELFPSLADRLSVTCVLAPVFFGDALSLSVRLERAVDLDAVRAALEAASGIELVDDDYPTVVGDALGQDVLYVGRLRRGLSDASELNLWIASDNVRKGAAQNAITLAAALIKHYP